MSRKMGIPLLRYVYWLSHDDSRFQMTACTLESYYLQMAWQCKLCGERTKHERNSVKHHLSQSHDLTWVGYKERTKHQQKGGDCGMKTEAPDVLSFVKEEVLDGVTLKGFGDA